MATLLLPGLKKNLQDRKDKYCIMTEKCGIVENMEDGDYIILNLQQFNACHEVMHEIDELTTTEDLIQYVYGVVRDLYFTAYQNPSQSSPTAKHAAAIAKCLSLLKGMQVSNKLIPISHRRRPRDFNEKTYSQNPHEVDWTSLKEDVENIKSLGDFSQARIFSKIYAIFSYIMKELLLLEHNEGSEVTVHPLDRSTVKWMKKVLKYYAYRLIPYKPTRNRRNKEECRPLQSDSNVPQDSVAATAAREKRKSHTTDDTSGKRQRMNDAA